MNSALVTPTVSASLGSIDQGQTSSLTSTAVTTGTSPYTYQWLQKAPGGSYSPISGATSPSYSFVTSGSTATGFWSFELQVTDATSAEITSNSVVVKVNAAPTVSVAPVGPVTLDVGQVQVFTATASGGSGALSYQWYLDAVAVGDNSVTYSYTVAGASHLVTCKVTDSASSPVTSLASNAVSITVNSALVAPSVSASLGSISQGQNSDLTSSSVTTGSSLYSYQWLWKAPGAGSFLLISGATSSSYSFVTSGSTAIGSWSFELQVTDAASASVTSNAVSVTVNTVPTVTVSPISWTMDMGQNTTFSAVASGGSGSYSSYQWYVGGSPQFGATSSTFSYAPLP